MRLTKRNIHSYLIDKNFLDPARIIAGDYLLTQSQSRNAIFRVSLGESSGLFVKQLISMDPQNCYLMQKDATAQYLIQHTDLYKKAQAYIPEYLGYDLENHVLISEYFPKAQNLLEHILEKKSLSTKYGEKLAALFSSYHHKIDDKVDTNRSLQFFTQQIPWIMNLPDTFGQKGAQVHTIISTILNDTVLVNSLEQLRADWKIESLIHGDVKLTNFIITKENDKENLKVIDWEIADLGDPLWDIAGLIQSYITTWAFSVPNPANGFIDSVDLNTISCDSLKEVLSDFWQHYVRLCKINKSNAPVAFLKTMKYVAARLLQSAFESNQFTPLMTPNAVRLIQLSQNIFKDPRELGYQLTGVRL